VRPAVVRFAREKMRAVALGLANAVGAKSVEPIGVAIPATANALLIVETPVVFSATQRQRGGGAGSPVTFRISFEDAKQLLAHPDRAAHRYRGLK
jgi:hypothetical protein